jgi:hypothetical protein
MDLHWISNPATQWGVLVLALLASLVLFISVKREIAIHSQTAKCAAELAQNSLSELAKEVGELREAGRTEPAPLPPRPGEAINLTRRSQALRMHARGESVPSIAAALRIPQNEIRLLVKLNEALSPAPASGLQCPDSMTAMLGQERS